MKKILILTLLVFTSCKKDRTCICTTSDGTNETTYTIIAKRQTKQQAIAGVCASYSIPSENISNRCYFPIK